jgi:hypothetical protein
MNESLGEIKGFNTILSFDPEKTNYATGKNKETNQEKISKVAHGVISYMQHTDKREDDLQLRTFAEKIKLIDQQFTEEGAQAAFTTTIHTLDLLLNLRTELEQQNHTLLSDPFIAELENLAEQLPENEKIKTAHKLLNFITNQLIPALQRCNSQKELQALTPLINWSQSLHEQLSSINSKGALANAAQALNTLHLTKQKNFRREQQPPQPKLARGAQKPVQAEPKKENHTQIYLKIQKRIQALDSKSTKFTQEVAQLKAELAELKKLTTEAGNGFSHLDNALDLLVNPTALHISEGEQQFSSLILRKCHVKPTDIAQYRLLQEGTVKDAQLFLIDTLKKNSGSLQTLLKEAPNMEKQTKDLAIQKRLERFADIYPLKPSLNNEFPHYFPILLRAFNAFTEETIKQFNESWNAICKKFDGETGGRFSELIKFYGYLNPSTQYKRLINDSQKTFFAELDLEEIDTAPDKSVLNKQLNNAMRELKKYPSELFETNYLEFFSEAHLWLALCAENIVQPFNQSDDVHGNLGLGVCHANSLLRFSLLQENPKTPSKEIEMGATSKTRFVQNLLSRTVEAAKRNQISFEGYLQETAKILSTSFGMRISHEHQLDTKGQTDLPAFLIEEIERYSKSGHKNFILVFKGPGGGHALNIQFDNDLQIYRILDDNLGICEFESAEMFKEHATAYFKDFYEEMNTFAFQELKPIAPKK